MRNLSNFFRFFFRRPARASATRVFGVCCAVLAGCSTAGTTCATPVTLAPSAAAEGLRLVLDHPDAPPGDTIEIFVCAVPVGTTDPTYGAMALRLPLDPGTIAAQLGAGVTPYFEQLSHGAYSPRFIAGSVLDMSTDELHDHCVERALNASDPAATTVLVVATAEHLASEPGGWGRPGSPCSAAVCPASITRRAAYVGASDFHPDNGPEPLLDLIEHEIGHTLDLPHSGDLGDEHASDLDLMSNSAAPRDVEPQRRSGQDTLAIDRLALGWLPASAIAVMGPDGGTVDLAPSTGTTGLRLLVLPLDPLRFITVEQLPASGLDDFLPAGGIAVHLVDANASACGRNRPTDGPCTGVDRRQITLGSSAPHLDLLSISGQTWHVERWDITLQRAAGKGRTEARVAVTPTQR
jgi:hypothetical protein